MKLGPFTIQIDVSREPCQCGAGPVTATVPVTLTMEPAPASTLDRLVFNLAIDATQAQRDTVKVLACKRCEL